MKRAYHFLIGFLLPATFCLLPDQVLASSEEDLLRASYNAIGREISDYTLIDQDGKSFRIRELFGKPLVISLIYAGCGPVCPTLTTHLQDAFRVAGPDFGTKFRALTISFDVENDTPARMRDYGRNFTDDFRKWRFSTADQKTIDRITRDLGFYYKKLATGFDHINMVTIVDQKGRIYQQVYGLDFKPEDLLDPVYQSMKLIKAPQSRSLTLIERIQLFCYKYDETTGRYKLDYGLLITLGIGSLLQVVTMIAIIYFVWGKDKRVRRHQAL